jgi:hypothetical protein
MSRNLSVLALCLLVGWLAGCAYKYQFITGLPATETRVAKTHHIVGWGWSSSEPFNLEEACPEGVAEFGSYISFLNWLPAFASFGVYAPRTIYAVCGNGGGSPP